MIKIKKKKKHESETRVFFIEDGNRESLPDDLNDNDIVLNIVEDK